jgi:hypothetical protein
MVLMVYRYLDVNSPVDMIPRTLEDLVDRVVNRKAIEKDMTTISQVNYTSGKPFNKSRNKATQAKASPSGVGAKHGAPDRVKLGDGKCF